MFKLVEDTTYTVKDLDTILDEAIKNGIQKSNTKVEYYNIIFAFDIETSNFTEKPLKGDTNNKRSIMYIWQDTLIWTATLQAGSTSLPSLPLTITRMLW